MSTVDASGGLRERSPIWLKALYGIVLLSAVALGLMLLQELIQVLEGNDPSHAEGLHHLAIFDIAWPVFVLSWLFTLLGGVATLVVGTVWHRRPALRYSVWALGFCLLSSVVVWIAAG